MSNHCCTPKTSMLLCQLHLFQLKFLHSCSGKDDGFFFLAPQVCLVYALHNFLGLKPIYTFRFAITLLFFFFLPSLWNTFFKKKI